MRWIQNRKNTYIHMTSKKYFLRLLKIQKSKMEKSFGTWNLSVKEKSEIWEDITNRSGRSWKNSDKK